MTPARLSCLFLSLLLSIPAWAGKSQTPPRTMQIQASMLISGNIVVAPDGSVAGYHLDKASRIPAGAKAEMAKAVSTWKFEPVLVNGKAVRAKAAMRVRLVARHVDKDSYSIGIESAWFPAKDADNNTSEPRAKRRTPPHYPPAAIKERVQGTVYTVLRINREGKVEKFAIRQVDLRARGNSRSMRRWRQMLAMASENAIKDWTYSPPTTGPEARQNHWDVVVPITFNLNFFGERHQTHPYGKWQAYIPGPRHLIPWLDEADKRLIANADALPNDGVFSAKQSLHLLTPPSG